MTGVLGGFFLGLAWDRISGQADTPGRVQFRAAQLRSAQKWLICVVPAPSLQTGALGINAMHTGLKGKSRLKT